MKHQIKAIYYHNSEISRKKVEQVVSKHCQNLGDVVVNVYSSGLLIISSDNEPVTLFYKLGSNTVYFGGEKYENGGMYFYSDTGEVIPMDYPDNAASSSKLLTKREFYILSMMSNGYTTREICLSINRHVKTVEAHRVRLIKKLNAKNGMHAVSIGYQLGILSKE